METKGITSNQIIFTNILQIYIFSNIVSFYKIYNVWYLKNG